MGSPGLLYSEIDAGPFPMASPSVGIGAFPEANSVRNNCLIWPEASSKANDPSAKNDGS